MFCAISGTAPVNPVVSKSSGLVYERDLILKYIKENDGRDPITGEALTEDDLIALKTSPSAPAAPPRPPTLSSIPALLHVLQNEWDGTMLEVLELRRSATKLRQELSFALYKEDAAMRVLARVMRERDDARAALSSIQSTLGVSTTDGAAANGSAPTDMDVDQSQATQNGLPADVETRVTETSNTLSATRRKRKPPAEWATAEEVGKLAEIEVVPSMHSTKPPGISSLDVAQDGALVLTGGNDKTVQVYERSSKKVISTLKGHTKKVNSAIFVGPSSSSDSLPPFIASASADKTVRLWSAGDASAKGGPYSARSTLTSHTGEVSSISAHPAGTLIASASMDSTWMLTDLSDGRVEANKPILHVTVPAASADSGALATGGATAISFHPDGTLLGVGCAGSHIRIFDIRTAEVAATFEGHTQVGGGHITSLAFSENGWLFASAAASSTGGAVQLWDMRKVKLSHSIPIEADHSVNRLAWDYTGQFLASVGSVLQVYQHKSYTELLNFDANAAELTGVKWAKNGRELIVAGIDRSVRVLGL